MTKSGEDWDLEIRPKRNLFDINLAELWSYRFLIVLFVRRDFVAQYKQTILGPLWHLLQPIFTAITFLVVFGQIAGIPTDGIPPVLFYITGIILWTLFSTVLLSTATTFVTSASIFGKVYFPRLVSPISLTFSGLLKFGIQFLLVLATLIWHHFNNYPIQISSRLLLLPVIIMMIGGIAFGVGTIISSVTAKYRDLSVLLSFVIQLGMYVTPVAYPYSFLQERSFAWVVVWNPLTPLFEAFKYCLFNLQGVQPEGLWYSLSFMVLVIVVGALVFNKAEATFMDTV